MTPLFPFPRTPRALLASALLGGLLVAPQTTRAATISQAQTVSASGAPLHPLGLNVAKTRAAIRAGLATQHLHPAIGATLPASVDLSANAPPAGDQGYVGSCAAWAESYDLRGYYAKLQGSYPAGGFAPMSTYATFSKGQDNGSWTGENAQVIVNQGVDTRSDYVQGDFDYTSQPTPAELANAAQYKIASWQYISADKTTLESWLAQGYPIAIAISVHPGFDNANASNNFIQPVTSGDYDRGGHEIGAFGYTSSGLLVLNSWGAGWGKNGWGVLSWAYVAQYAWGGAIEVPLAGPTPSGTATPTATPTKTATPTPRPTNTATPRPTATKTPTPRPTNTPTKTPTPRPTPTKTPTPRPTPTKTPTPRPTPTKTPTPRPTNTPTNTPTPRPTNTPAPPTATPTSTNTPGVPTDTPTPGDMPVLPTATATPPPHVSIVSTSAYGPVAVGKSVGIATFVQSDRSISSEGIEIAIASSSGRQVYDTLQFWPLQAGVTRGAAIIWPVPTNMTPGTYTVRVGVYSTFPSTIDASNATAATFTVTAH